MHTKTVHDPAGQTGQRGILRVYLGASPGVGKTFAMLDEGQRRASRGTDVVVGFVETHGRVHTAEQVADLGCRSAWGNAGSCRCRAVGR